ncbi:DUF4340 domain-containing protein [Pseudomonadota bacterium]|nr:DUF4340 domain-containing protein [Pseudomonadota bacterium]
MRTVMIMATMAIAAVAYILFLSVDLNGRNTNQYDLLFPDLFNALDKVEKIKLEKEGNKLVLKKTGEQWLIESADNYPANVSAIKKFLLNLTEIKTLTVKTTDPSLYRSLAVNSIEEEGQNRFQITISIESGIEIAEFTVKEKFHNDNRTFIKKADKQEVFETQGALALSINKIKWLHADITDLPSKAINKISVDHIDEQFTLIRMNDSSIHFKIDELDGDLSEKSPVFTSALAAFLESLKFNDVKGKKIIIDSKRLSSFVFATTNNEEIKVEDFQTASGVFTEFSIVKKPSSETNSIFIDPNLIDKFVFKLPKYKRRLLERRLSDLTKKSSNE